MTQVMNNPSKLTINTIYQHRKKAKHLKNTFTFVLTRYTSLILLCYLFLPNASATETFVFSAIPDQDQSKLIQRFSKLQHYLTDKLGVEVKYVPVKTYAAAITAFRRGDVQLAWFGGLSGVRARLFVPHAEAIAQGYEDQFFKSYLIAHRSTKLAAGQAFPADIQGLTFTFGSKGSTSGRLMPEFYITQHLNKNPKELFKTVGFSGNHSRTVALVESGAYQVGAVNYKVWDRLVAEGKVDTNNVSVIWQTPDYPDYHWTIRGDVDKTWGKGFKEKVTQTILGIKDADILAAFPRTKFIAASNTDYQTIATVAKEINLLN